MAVVTMAPNQGARAMAFQSYASFKGTKQGQLKGAATKANRSDKWSEVVSFEMGRKVPLDPSGGGPQGKRRHHPIVITREVDSTSSELLQACFTSEVLLEVVIETRLQGHVAKRITLGDALIGKFLRFTKSPHGTATRKPNFLEEFSFTFGKILVENLAAGTSTTDDVTANNQ